MNDIRVEKFSRRLNCGAKVTIFREIVCAPEADEDGLIDLQGSVEYDEES